MHYPQAQCPLATGAIGDVLIQGEEGMSEAVVSHAAADCATAGVVAPSKVQEWNHGKFLAR